MTYKIPIEPQFREMTVHVGSVIEWRWKDGTIALGRVCQLTSAYVITERGAFIEPKDIVAQYARIVS